MCISSSQIRNMKDYLEFTEVKRRYYMGHDLEETLITRSDFTDEFYLHRMWGKLRGHPVNQRV